MKRTLLSAVMLMLALIASAIPARRTQRTLTLANGEQVTATLRGDETFHYWEASDGRVFVGAGDGQWSEMTLDEAQTRLAQGVSANNARRRARRVRFKATWGAETNPISGERKGLVILVNYKDKKLQHTRAEYDDYFNKEGYSANGCTGSVRDYFMSQSYGKFVLDFDVVGPVTLSKNLSYYGSNDSNGDDMYAGAMVAEAVKLALQGKDLQKYDWDGDGYVDQVYVVYAGYGEHAGAADNTIWPHEYNLSSAAKYGDGPGAVTIGGVTVDTYACSCELRGTSGATMDGIGTACHEFSHCMAIPDMYDVNYKNFGMSDWDLMDSGSYRGKDDWGETPAPYTSYERMYCGWLTPIELKQGCTVTDMPAITDEPVAYLLRNDNPRYPNEYYLLENHQQKGWDKYAPAHGMLVLHVDFDSNAWSDNEVNTTANHQRMTIIPADGKYSDNDLLGDTWPGTSKKTALTDTSSPAATLYNANSQGRKFMGRPIENIAEKSGKISFTFDGGQSLPQLTTPVIQSVSQKTADGFTLNWSKVQGATSYEVQLTTSSSSEASIEDCVVLDEDFAGFMTGTTDGSQDLSSKMDTYTHQPGWSGAKLYTTASDAVKMGSSRVMGQLTTPPISPNGTDLSILFAIRQYGANDNEIQVNYVSPDGKQTVVGTADLGAEYSYLYASFENVDDQCRIQLQSNKRAYVDRFVVIDGIFPDEDYDKLVDILESKVAKREVRKIASNSVVTTSAQSYTFTDLSPENVYTCRVRALANGYTASEWSEAVQIELSTGIDGVTEVPSASQEPVYDLQGRRVAKPSHGVYIQGRRKYVVR